MNQLIFDTSTESLIVVLKTEEKVDFIFELTIKDHSSKLLPAIEGLLSRNHVDIKDINAIYVTEGPGSYTGVRIGVTVAKMLCFSLNIPLYKISTLKFLSASYINEGQFIVPMIDARRGNVFSSLYEVKNGKLINIISDSLYAFDDLLQKIKNYTNQAVCFVGRDSIKFKDKIESFDQFFIKSQLETDFNSEHILKLEFDRVDNLHTFVPSYKRLSEAELNLLL